MRSKFFIWMLFFSGIFLFQGSLYGYSKKVHIQITRQVINQNKEKLDKSINDYTGLNNGVNEFLSGSKRIRDWIEEGSWTEDLNIDILTSHFYNPLTNKGLTEMGVTLGESAYDRTNNPSNAWSWKWARDVFYSGLTAHDKTTRNINLSHAFEALGHAIHLVQDVAVPAHTRDDMHTNDPYENYANSHIISLNYTLIPFPYWNVSISTYAPKQFWDLESYNGSTVYESGYIGLSEYTNASFFSQGTIFRNFPHPSYEDTNYLNIEWNNPEKVDAEDGKLDNRIYIKKLAGDTGYSLAALSYFSYDCIKKGHYEYSPLVLDDKVHSEYASRLLPRAVGYSAGLLNYFFRGQIDMVSDPNNPGKYVIKNLSSENMSGTFSLYYDDTSDNRHLITNWDLSLDTGGQSVPVNFTEPTSPEPKEKGKYLLVFQGSVGNEREAVAGKAVTLKKEIDARMVIVSRYDSTNYIRVATKNAAWYFPLPQKDFGQPQAVRFDVDNPNEFVVVTLQADNAFPYGEYGVYKFHKFKTNETTQIIEYKDIVSTYTAVQNRDSNCSELCSRDVLEEDGTECGDDYYSILFKVHDCTNVLNSNYFVDVFVKGGLIKPFGITRYVQTKTAGEDYYAMNSNCTDYVPMGWGYSLTYEYNITTSIYFGSVVKNIPFSSRGFYSSDPQCFGVSGDEAERPPYYWPTTVFNESDYAYGYNNESILTLPISFTGQWIKKTMIRKNGKYSFTTSSKSYASEIGAADCTGFLIGENRIGVRVDTWGTSVVKFNSCSNWETLFSLTGTSLYPENRYLYDVILSY